MNKNNEQLEILRRIEAREIEEKRVRREWVINEMKKDRINLAFFIGFVLFFLLEYLLIALLEYTFNNYRIEISFKSIIIPFLIPLLISFSISKIIYVKFIKKEIDLSEEEIELYILNYNKRYHNNHYYRSRYYNSFY